MLIIPWPMPFFLSTEFAVQAVFSIARFLIDQATT